MSEHSNVSLVVLPVKVYGDGQRGFLLDVWIQEIPTHLVMSSRRSAYHHEDKRRRGGQIRPGFVLDAQSVRRYSPFNVVDDICTLKFRHHGLAHEG